MLTLPSSLPTQAREISEKPLIRIAPPEFQFHPAKNGIGLVSRLTVRNLLQNSIAIKFKTNAPLRYSVKPVQAVLAPRESIQIYVRSDGPPQEVDRFLMQSVSLTADEAKAMDAEGWRRIERWRIMENLINCRIADGMLRRESAGQMGMKERNIGLEKGEPEKTKRQAQWALVSRYSRVQVLVVSFLCILVGLMLPFEQYLSVFFHENAIVDRL
ncbi:uncharacterized protein VTP21DRAFT_10332 [Calcarisporiella thermophila]|uniref:uncharacterized protein n=1 Tax=Calcarisporiella thermophila TaxID=911321 RepID=UPI00374301FA